MALAGQEIHLATRQIDWPYGGAGPNSAAAQPGAGPLAAAVAALTAAVTEMRSRRTGTPRPVHVEINNPTGATSRQSVLGAVDAATMALAGWDS